VAFADIYGLKDEAHTVLRGTLRFAGWCALMRSFAILGLLDRDAESAGNKAAAAAIAAASAGTGAGGATWGDLLNALAAARGCTEGPAALLAQSDVDNSATTDVANTSSQALACLKWLGCGPGDSLPPPPHPLTAWPSVSDLFAAQLAAKLTLQPGECDLVNKQSSLVLWTLSPNSTIE